MILIKRSLFKTPQLFAITIFSLVFLITRIPFLGFDEINPDAVNWHLRSEQFVVGLKNGDLIKTYQHYHPGVTLMWTMGIPVEIYRQLVPQDRVYNESNFITQHRIAKYSLIAVQLAVTLLLIYALKDILGLKKSLLAVSLFTFEPFFTGNSRLLHMDVLLTLFVMLALTYAYKYRVYMRRTDSILSGVFAGLSFLTKSVGALTILLIIFFLAIPVLKDNENRKKHLYHLGAFILSAALVTIALFPALWTDPAFVLSDIYNEGLRIGTRRGHEQVIMGEQADTAGPEFYPLVLALKTSPLLWLGVVLFLFQLIRHRRRYQSVDLKYLAFLSVFYLIYFIGMSSVSKKIDRYMIPLYPLLGLVSALGIFQALNDMRERQGRRLLILSLTLFMVIGVICPLLRSYPYYFTYTNPVFGPAERANRIIGQKPFGIGIWELKNMISQKYGSDVSLGFIDKKPMSMIYKNSRLHDIREIGTGKYDLVILGPNEVMPENVTGGKFKFAYDSSMYINGLEFWRIYKKVQ